MNNGHMEYLSQTDDFSALSNDDHESQSYWKEQMGRRHSEEAISDITPKSNVDDDIIEFNAENMKTFDDIYNYMEHLLRCNAQIEVETRSKIQGCISGGTLKLKRF